MVILAAACITRPVHSAQALLPREVHPWGGFGVGTWKRVRVTSETLNEKGEVSGVTTSEITTSLVAADEQFYTLKVEVVVEVSGKRFVAQPQVITQGYSGESSGQVVDVKSLGESSVSINGERVPSEIRQATISGNESSRITKVHYSPDVAPFVLKRETTATDGEGKSTGIETNVEVIAVDMPYKVLAELRNTSYVRTTNKGPKGSTVTLEVNSEEVPGGVIAHTSKEMDQQGRVIRRSTLDLVDYHISNDDESRLYRNRRQQRRAERQARYTTP